MVARTHERRGRGLVIVDDDQSLCEAVEFLTKPFRDHNSSMRFSKRLIGAARRDGSEPSWSSGDGGMMH